ncbi:MAG: 30S ribosomal protein S20 [Candidatus Wolfebacteria bacterium]|nr:30S ribosomal protein S20 [Candidatus Wolfebacteria bacterium]
MPKIKSAKKALRQNVKRRAVNEKRKIDLKTVIKDFKKMIETGKQDEAKAFLSTVYKKLDKSEKVDLIKKNKASRLKSRLTKLVNKK